MSTTAFPISAQEAQRQAAQFSREMNAGRRLADIPDAIKQLSKEKQVFIFNVGPWAHTQLMGSFGTIRIPACKEGEPFSEPVLIDGIPTEQYPMNEAQMTAMMYDGWTHAHEIIGIGKHLSPSNALTQYGVGVSREWPPSEEDLRGAQHALRNKLEDLVNEANLAMAQGPKIAEETIRPEQHFIAARLLKKTVAECPWMNRSVKMAERIACQFCGEPMGAELPKCPNCKEIVNQAAYDAAKRQAKGKE